MEVVALVSGADSEVLVAELLAAGSVVHPLYVRCGFRWEAAELSRLRAALRSLKSPRLRALTVARAPMDPFLRGHWSLTGRRVPGARSDDREVYLPGRNMVLLLMAWLHASARGACTVVLGTLKSNPFPDGTERFRKAAEKALNLAMGANIRARAPYAKLKKDEVLSRAGRFRLSLAFSCLAPRRGKACGRCNKCAELAAALKTVGPRSSPPRRRRRPPAP